MVEQSLGLSKKLELSRVTVKQFGNPNSSSSPKKSKESWKFKKSTARSAMPNRV